MFLNCFFCLVFCSFLFPAVCCCCRSGGICWTMISSSRTNMPYPTWQWLRRTPGMHYVFMYLLWKALLSTRRRMPEPKKSFFRWTLCTFSSSHSHTHTRSYLGEQGWHLLSRNSVRAYLPPPPFLRLVFPRWRWLTLIFFSSMDRSRSDGYLSSRASMNSRIYIYIFFIAAPSKVKNPKS